MAAHECKLDVIFSACSTMCTKPIYVFIVILSLHPLRLLF